MTHYPTPSDFEAQTNATYEALMWALSRPGRARGLPQAGQAGIILTLIDRECAIYTDSEELRAVAASTGAHPVAAECADHLFLTSVPNVAFLRQLRQGSDMYPEEGATLVLPASFKGNTRLRLTGPGVDGEITINLDAPPVIWTARKQIMRYPMGFEIFLVDGDQVIGLPRTTEIEVL
ncbi:phosphonate C-P lyase system protein PhnH [Yoonia sp. GPGPB17]|uniref:phosphonate C-P lyase system protein PhnH n=1 Tax=Yoonia sp. GPGPB17 TaxID=3026147 RepID=UPI0030BFC46E